MFTEICVPDVRNPISLAKLILDKSKQPLSLRRVSPNALVGEGAKLFAQEHGIPIVPNEYMISKNAGDRFLRWQEDLKRAETRTVEEAISTKVIEARPVLNPTVGSSVEPTSKLHLTKHIQQRDHLAAILTGTWNEGQPDSPYRDSPSSLDYTDLVELSNQFLSIESTNEGQSPAQKRPRLKGYKTSNTVPTSTVTRFAASGLTVTPTTEPGHDGYTSPNLKKAIAFEATPSSNSNSLGVSRPETLKRPLDLDKGDDIITDTVGAIAIDDNGNIAAGSSSGGIGMKHRGRLGPAALVGVGTAVVPCHPSDGNAVSVAAVTSGTGEHMATTMAAQRCAERIYSNTRCGVRGNSVPEYDEDSIMESFINMDFMNHPGVKNCTSVGAIGVMAVKKTKSGYYLFFGHNTDSFALASFGPRDKQPMCAMSRLTSNLGIARGARKISIP
jgi:taspase, threonine aspartase, 1